VAVEVSVPEVLLVEGAALTPVDHEAGEVLHRIGEEVDRGDFMVEVDQEVGEGAAGDSEVHNATVVYSFGAHTRDIIL
jgi:hypothetical protein